MNARQPAPDAGSKAIFESLFRLIKSCSTPRTILILFGLLLAFVPAFVALDVHLGGTTPPDALFGYSAEQAYRAFEAEGDGGRRHHLLFEVVDLLLIPVYSLLYATTIAYTGQRLFGQSSRVVNLGISVPLVAGLVDYAENGLLMSLLLIYPQPLVGLATVAGVFTMAKWTWVYTGISLAGLGLLGLLGQALLRWHQRRHERSGEVRRLELPRPPVAAA
jgi:positive regulator of sigma E activity